MQFHEFLGQVQNRAQLGSLGDAESATRATLETLGERLRGGEPKDVAAQLPDGIAQYFQGPNQEEAERFDLQGFFERVTQRSGLPPADAVYQARAVIEVLQEAVSPGEIADIKAQLTDDYKPLFESGSSGKL